MDPSQIPRTFVFKISATIAIPSVMNLKGPVKRAFFIASAALNFSDLNQSKERHKFFTSSKNKYSMKKAFITSLIIILASTASFSQTFGIGGVHRGGTSPVMKQRMKEKLKSELQLTDDQANAVVVIQQDYELKARAVKIDTNTSDEEKKEKLQPIEEERKQKLKKILSDEQINKIDRLTKDLNKMRGQKQA